LRLPRGLSGEELARALQGLGYSVTRQTGSHLRLTARHEGQHHITIPRHPALRVGTLSEILGDVAEHLKTDRATLVRRLFG